MEARIIIPTSTAPVGLRSNLKKRCFVNVLQLPIKFIVILKLRYSFEREPLRICGIVAGGETLKDVTVETGSD